MKKAMRAEVLAAYETLDLPDGSLLERLQAHQVVLTNMDGTSEQAHLERTSAALADLCEGVAQILIAQRLESHYHYPKQKN